jgi:hypothetical protein
VVSYAAKGYDAVVLPRSPVAERVAFVEAALGLRAGADAAVQMGVAQETMQEQVLAARPRADASRGACR